MPEKYKNIIIETFAKLKQRIIWKYEEDIPSISHNVLLKKWLPQQDLLGNISLLYHLGKKPYRKNFLKNCFKLNKIVKLMKIVIGKKLTLSHLSTSLN